jgi:Family of unknown function (DUF6920)
VTSALTVDHLWESVPAGHQRPFSPARISHLPAMVQRYLTHAIAQQTPLASAVRLRMHGEIKLKRWHPFDAVQVLRWDRGMIWEATIRWHGIPIRGFDRVVDGIGAMKWKLFGATPIVSASGPDVTRSAIGRIHAESIWLPSGLCEGDVAWGVRNQSRIRARFTAYGRGAELDLKVQDDGRLEAVKLPRWGNPDGKAFRDVDFGALVEAEATFSGYTIPSRLRVGWRFDGAEFRGDGEFFRVTVDDAAYR